MTYLYLYWKILATLDRMSSLDVEGAVRYVAGLQNADGSFCGDKWGEVDTRFSMCATATLAILVSLISLAVFYLPFEQSSAIQRRLLCWWGVWKQRTF